MKRLILTIFILLLVLPLTASAARVAPVFVLHVDGQIDPATASYIKGGIQDAEDSAAQAVLIRMDTFGGALDSTHDITKAFFASHIPVIVYISPNGATAGSAGTFITMAADIAAMSPVSSIGSATPVSGSPGSEGKELGPTMKKKVVNFTSEYAKSIAEKRGRNADWAEKAVREAVSLTSTKALKMNVIDYIASSNRDLMKKIDGKRIKLATGETVVLHTARAPLENKPAGTWVAFLHILSNPLVALLLFTMAMYGIIFELSNPGAILPGVVGGISAILLLYSFSVIPINVAGFAFIGLALALFIIDIHTPTHGILSVGGVISLFFGLMMLFRSPEGPMISPWILALVALVTGGFFVFVIALGVRALKNPYVSGREGVVGHVGEARTDLNPTGSVFVDGALWTATSDSGPVAKGEKVDVITMTGLKLTVHKHEED